MRDQAVLLRQIMSLEPPSFENDGNARVTLVGSGKGGVGKSIVSILLARRMAEAGRKVLLFDGDQNLANLHVMLGLEHATELDAVVHEESQPELLIRPVADNLWLLPGDTGSELLQAMTDMDRARLHHRLSAVFDAFDEVIVDAAAGIESAVRVVAMRTDRFLVLTVPEPAALSDAYALIKIANFQAPATEIGVIVNRTLDDSEGELAFARLEEACEQFLGKTVQFCGSIPDDRAILSAARVPGGILTLPWDTPAASQVNAIAGLIYRNPQVAPVLHSV